MRQPDVWWDSGERTPAPELVPRDVMQEALDDFAAHEPVSGEVA